jgi:hypothetical protein
MCSCTCVCAGLFALVYECKKVSEFVREGACDTQTHTRTYIYKCVSVRVCMCVRVFIRVSKSTNFKHAYLDKEASTSHENNVE